MIRAVPAHNLPGLVHASIVNDQPPDFFKTIDRPGKSREGDR